jgi:hypothetical protein
MQTVINGYDRLIAMVRRQDKPKGIGAASVGGLGILC